MDESCNIPKDLRQAFFDNGVSLSLLIIIIVKHVLRRHIIQPKLLPICSYLNDTNYSFEVNHPHCVSPGMFHYNHDTSNYKV